LPMDRMVANALTHNRTRRSYGFSSRNSRPYGFAQGKLSELRGGRGSLTRNGFSKHRQRMGQPAQPPSGPATKPEQPTSRAKSCQNCANVSSRGTLQAWFPASPRIGKNRSLHRLQCLKEFSLTRRSHLYSILRHRFKLSDSERYSGCSYNLSLIRTRLMQSIIPAIGSTSLGIVVGFLVRYFIRRFSKCTPAALGSIISIAVGVTAVKFLAETPTVWWFYPIGLLIGFALYFIFPPRSNARVQRR